jgi:hypothetical protein
MAFHLGIYGEMAVRVESMPYLFYHREGTWADEILSGLQNRSQNGSTD